MRNWIENLTETELEVMRVTLRASIQSDELGFSTRQNAKILLDEVEDYLWSNVCRGSPVSSDQPEIDLQ